MYHLDCRTPSTFTRNTPSSAFAADRYEVTAIKGVRPTLVRTADALAKGDVTAAREAFADYDSAWNGVEVYINTRSRDMYAALETQMQAKLTEGLNAVMPNLPDLVAQAKALEGRLTTMFGAPFAERRAAARQGSPITHVTADDPPVITLHGTRDELVPISQAESFDAAARKAGTRHLMIRVVNGGHGFDHPETKRRERQFLDHREAETHQMTPHPAGDQQRLLRTGGGGQVAFRIERAVHH
mgnify:CR=1 FL=1